MASFKKTVECIYEIIKRIHAYEAFKNPITIKCDADIRNDLYYLIFPERKNHLDLNIKHVHMYGLDGKTAFDDTIGFHSASQLIDDFGLVQITKYDDTSNFLSLTRRGYRVLFSDVPGETLWRYLKEENK